jgi:hypothetical protein
MKQFIELGAVRIGAAIQNVGAKVDFEVLSLPGGSLIAVLLWLNASAMGSIRRACLRRMPQHGTIHDSLYKVFSFGLFARTSPVVCDFALVRTSGCSDIVQGRSAVGDNRLVLTNELVQANVST